MPMWVWDIAIAAVILTWMLESDAAHKTDWSYYEAGQKLLFGTDGLHLYAAHPVYQIGPLALLVARALTMLSGDGRTWDVVLTAVLLAPVLTLSRRLVTVIRPDSSRNLAYVLGWSAVGLGWFPLVAIGQFGDALAVLAALAAMVVLLDERPMMAGALFSLGCAAKPWTLVLLPLLLFTTSRARLRAVLAAALVGLITWGPFVLASPETLYAARLTFVVPAYDWQRLIGIGDSAPTWWRGVQLALCWAVGIMLWTRSRRTGDWATGLAAAGGVIALVRVLSDLGTHPYYLSVALPLIWVADRAMTSESLPWSTILSFLPIVTLTQPLGEAGASTARVAALCLALAVLVRRWLTVTHGGSSPRSVPTSSAATVLTQEFS